MNAPAVSAMTMDMIGVPIAAPGNWATTVPLARWTVPHGSNGLDGGSTLRQGVYQAQVRTEE